VSRLHSPDGLALGIDIGGSKTALGVVRLDDGAVLGRRIVATPPRDQTGPAFLAELALHAGELRHLDGASSAGIDRLGFGVCELVDRSGQIVSAHRVVLDRRALCEAFGGFGEVSVDSDVRAAAVAEARFGRGRGLGHWIYVNAGTGISSVLMNGEACHVGAHGWVYSLGMSPADLSASTGGSIEDVGGASGLVSRARRRGLEVSAVRDLVEAAGSGSRIAVEVLATGGRVLGGAVALLANTIDPEAIVVGGGIASVDSPYWQALVTAVEAHIWHPPAKRIAIHRAALSVDAGMIGAALRLGSRLR